MSDCRHPNICPKLIMHQSFLRSVMLLTWTKVVHTYNVDSADSQQRASLVSSIYPPTTTSFGYSWSWEDRVNRTGRSSPSMPSPVDQKNPQAPTHGSYLALKDNHQWIKVVGVFNFRTTAHLIETLCKFISKVANIAQPYIKCVGRSWTWIRVLHMNKNERC